MIGVGSFFPWISSPLVPAVSEVPRLSWEGIMGVPRVGLVAVLAKVTVGAVFIVWTNSEAIVVRIAVSSCGVFTKF